MGKLVAGSSCSVQDSNGPLVAFDEILDGANPSTALERRSKNPQARCDVNESMFLSLKVPIAL
jgi:hypothetical protein